jgi:hypothetical protein
MKRCRKINTVAEILKSDLPTVASIKKTYGEDFIQAYIEGWIVNLREFVNVGKKMTDEQTSETSILVVDEYYNLNLADINFIFKNAKIGNYGQIYGRLDGQIILTWFDDHFNKRCSVAADESIQESEKYKGDDFERTSKQIAIKELTDKAKVVIEKYKFNNIT